MSRRAGRVRLMLVVALAVSTGACGTVRRLTSRTEPVSPEAVERARLEELKTRAREAVPVSPQVAQPSTPAGTRVWRTALGTRGLRVMVGTESRALWLMRDSEVLFRAPVAVGMEEDFTYRGKRYDFDTPLGRRKVQAKGTMPLWVPPDWHYFEIAHEQNLEAVHLRKGQRARLTDGTIIEVRGNEVGRINQFGNFWPFTPGNEIVFDGKIFIPPIGTRQRQVPEILGTHKLEIGDGYLIHGTNMDTSIGDAVSHGCVRMYNEDVARLFDLVPVGTPVFIY